MKLKHSIYNQIENSVHNIRLEAVHEQDITCLSIRKLAAKQTKKTLISKFIVVLRIFLALYEV